MERNTEETTLPRPRLARTGDNCIVIARPPDSEGKSGRQLALLFLTVVIGLAAIALEGSGHIIGGMFGYGDPLPHAGYLVAYLVAVLAPIFVRFVTVRSESPLLLAIAACANAFSMLMGFAMIFALIPIFPIALLLSLFGIGLLGFSPHFVFVLGILQRFALGDRMREVGLRRSHGALSAMATVIAAAAVLFVQPYFVGGWLADALRPGISASKERQLADKLHRYGGDPAVLTLCYRTPLPLWERWGMQYRWGHDIDPWSMTARSRDDSAPQVKQARRLYFLMTGRTYAEAPVPWTVSNYRTEQWINDVAVEEVGGTRVGRPVPGLSLDSAVGSATLDTRSATGACDWTMTFRNAGRTENEARAEILLPPGAVLHQASLWIDGVERPAAFGPQATVRRAYQEVAVVQRRDPLLVTMPTPGKLFVQCFPVPAYGTMKVRLGVTFPLTPDPADRREMRYTLPAFGPTNFTHAGQLAETIAVRDAATGSAPAVPLTLPSAAHWSERAGARQPVHLLVTLDSGAGMQPVFGAKERAALQAALRDLPLGSTVRFAAAGEPERGRASALPLLPMTKGIDAVPDLTEWTQRLAPEETLLYLHGPVPDAVSDPAPLAKAVKSLDPLPDGRPRFLSVLLTPNAPDVLGDRLAMQKNARVYSAALTNGDFAPLLDLALDVAVRGDRLTETTAIATPEGETRRARLRAYQAALTTWYERSNFGVEALQAARAAAALRLVTPLSGAVVLATQEDYKKYGLDDGTDKDAAKKVSAGVAPEPGTVVLMLGAGAVVLLAAGRRGRERRKAV